MKKTLLAAYMVFLAFRTYPQGEFNFSSFLARTHIGSIDGPLAGRGIWAEALAGPCADMLAPVGQPSEHIEIGGIGTGLVFGGSTAVPGIFPGDTAYVKMVAWNGSLWGTALSGVPADQLGMTDTVPVVLSDIRFGSPNTPHFTQPAIVPIPEPSALAIAVIGATLFWFVSQKRRTRPVTERGQSRIIAYICR